VLGASPEKRMPTLGTTPGAAGYYTSGGNTIVRASNDADSTAELEVQLAGLKTLSVRHQLRRAVQF
jgi:hypothetical protein